MIRVRCPATDCGKSYRVAPDAVGRQLRCKVCGQEFVAEAASTDTLAGSLSDTDSLIPPAPAFLRKPTKLQESPQRISRFEIRQKLGQGAFGTVYRAYDPQLEREVAIKVPQAGLLTTPEIVERFLREAKAAARLNHPNIVPVYDAGRDGDQYYIAAAFIDGQPLSDCIERYQGNHRLIAVLVRKLASALDSAHAKGIVHRDVKPHNVMIDAEGEPHLMDFGVAQVGDAAEKLTHDGAIIGTPAYMSPEQAAGGSAKVTADSDQYSLGVILFELLTGNTPFSGGASIIIFNLLNTTPPAPRSLKQDLPRDLDTICQKALGREPEQRYRGCAAMAEDLGRYLDGKSTLARPIGPLQGLVRTFRRDRRIVWFLLSLMATVLIGAISAGSLALVAHTRQQSLLLAEAAVADQHRRTASQLEETRALLDAAAERERMLIESAELAKRQTLLAEARTVASQAQNHFSQSGVLPELLSIRRQYASAAVQTRSPTPASIPASALDAIGSSRLLVYNPEGNAPAISWFKVADQPRFSSLYPSRRLRIVRKHEFNADRPFKRLNEVYESNGVLGIRSQSNTSAWNFTDMVAGQLLRVKMRVRYGKSSNVGLSLTQRGDSYGTAIWIAGTRCVVIEPGIFAKHKDNIATRRYELPTLIHPVDEWNEIACAIQKNAINVFVNGVHIHKIDTAQKRIDDAILALGIRAGSVETTVECSEYILYSIW